MRLMKARRLFLLIGLLAFVLVLAIAPEALAKSTPVLTTTALPATATAQAASTTAHSATATAQAASTTIHVSLFVAGLVVGLLFFGLVRTVDASRIKGHQLAVDTSRQVTEQGHSTRGTST